jgi:ATP:ADP antiporter, AAA family
LKVLNFFITKQLKGSGSNDSLDYFDIRLKLSQYGLKNMSSSTKEFGKIRSFLWPIHRSELRIFLPMLFIYFLICFTYNILRGAKDALVVTAPASGAEIIPFIKVWGILPMALLITFIFTHLSNRFSREKVFYLMMSIFLGFFFLFDLVLYPYRDYLHPHNTATWLATVLPAGFSGLISIFHYWTYSAFYIMSELWGTMIMTVLFWGFANEVTPIKDAKRFYALVLIGGNLAGCCAGQALVMISRWGSQMFLPFGDTSWTQTIHMTCILVIFTGLLASVLFRWLNRKGMAQMTAGGFLEEKMEIKMGLRENFAYIVKSKYLLRIAIIVVAYHFAINLTEVLWKDQIKILYPNPNDYNAYMGEVLRAMGIISSIIAIAISGNIIRRLSWTFSAMIPAIILLVTGIGFFSFLFFKDTKLMSVAASFGTTPLILCVFFGSLQNSLCRATKYTFFDATKELAFIPLGKECKLKGKAAIDGIGSRLGKSGGSVIHQTLLMLLGSIALSTPYVAAILLFVIGGWIFAVRSLGRKFKRLTEGESETPLPTSSVLPTQR